VTLVAEQCGGWKAKRQKDKLKKGKSGTWNADKSDTPPGWGAREKAEKKKWEKNKRRRKRRGGENESNSAPENGERARGGKSSYGKSY